MPYFIKTGLWEKSTKGFKGWLNLEEIFNELFSEKLNITNPAIALTDAATIDLSTAKHTLISSSAARTFTISYPGDDITLEVTLNNTLAVYTFPVTALGVSEGVATGDNTITLTGSSSNKYIIGIKKIGNAYYVVSKNFSE